MILKNENIKKFCDKNAIGIYGPHYLEGLRSGLRLRVDTKYIKKEVRYFTNPLKEIIYIQPFVQILF